MSPDIALISFIGAIALLLYGINTTGQALQRVAGQRLRHLLALLGDNRLAAVGVGAAVTALMQSSGATTLMLVGFARAGLIEMRQTIGLILGADIGSTLTVQLLAFRIYDYALLFVAVGAGLLLASKRRSIRDSGQAILGFGLVFLALRTIIETVAPLRDNPLMFELFANLGGAPLLAFLLAAMFAALTTSSTATIGIAIALAVRGGPVVGCGCSDRPRGKPGHHRRSLRLQSRRYARGTESRHRPRALQADRDRNIPSLHPARHSARVANRH